MTLFHSRLTSRYGGNDLLLENGAKPLDEIIQTVMNKVGAWTHDPAVRDDITILLARKF